MVFQGDVLPIRALRERAQPAPAYEPGADVGVRHTAADNAARCAVLLSAGDTPEACWRFGILQTLDDYASTLPHPAGILQPLDDSAPPLRRGGVKLAAEVFAPAPAPTGSVRIDAAFAALADHLAEHDGWPAPAWATDPARRADGWYPAVPTIFRAEAEQDSPRAFRPRGILITGRSLDRA